MYQAHLRVNGRLYLGIGKTRSEASQNAQALISEKHSAGFALVTKKWQRVEAATK